jgi:hypothetical protein
MDRNALHDEIDATYTTFERDGRVLLQIDTWPRDPRNARQEKPDYSA